MAPQKAATGKEEVEEVAGPAGPTKITHAAGLLQSDQRAFGIFQQGLSWWGNPRGPIVNQAPRNRGGRGKKKGLLKTCSIRHLTSATALQVSCPTDRVCVGDGEQSGAASCTSASHQHQSSALGQQTGAASPWKGGMPWCWHLSSCHLLLHPALASLPVPGRCPQGGHRRGAHVSRACSSGMAVHLPPTSISAPDQAYIAGKLNPACHGL